MRTDEERHDTKSGTIYFVQDFHRSGIKIGYATNVLARIMALQTANPLPLLTLGTTPGDRGLERRLHKQFDAYRLIGEWYKPHAALLETIKELCDDSTDLRKPVKSLIRMAKRRRWVGCDGATL